MSDSELLPDNFAPDDTSGLSDTELRQLLADARASGNDTLRRLLASYVTLRRLSSDMVAFIETREGAATVTRTPLFRRLKQLTRRSAA